MIDDRAKDDEIHAEKDLRKKIKLFKKYFPGCSLRSFRMQFLGYTSDDWHLAAKYWGSGSTFTWPE